MVIEEFSGRRIVTQRPSVIHLKTAQPPYDMHGGCVASLILLSLNHDFTSVVDVDALLSRLAREFSAVEHEPSIAEAVILQIPVVDFDDARHRLPVTEIECKGVDARTECACREGDVHEVSVVSGQHISVVILA